MFLTEIRKLESFSYDRETICKLIVTRKKTSKRLFFFAFYGFMFLLPKIYKG